MPAVKSLIFKYYTLLTSSITYNSKIISLYSCCAKKGLIYIIIADPSSCQPFFYFKCTKLNTYALYNIYLVSLNKYIFLTYFTSL